jgi:hypothetical protein
MYCLFVCSLFNNACSDLECGASSERVICEGGGEGLWPNLRYYPSILLEKLRKMTKMGGRSAGRDLNTGPLEYKAVM